MSLNNETQTLNNTSSVSTITIILDIVKQPYSTPLSLIMTILGLIGFLGNIFTFLQPALRKNSFCIYTLCGSLSDVVNILVNLIVTYLFASAAYLNVMNSIQFVCKLRSFAYEFLPQLSMNLLIMSLIDRYACTYAPKSRMRRLLQLRMVPWLIGITVAISCVMSLYPVILYDIVPGVGCSATHSLIYSIFYILIQGIITPLVMVIIVLLTYRRFKQNRQRVVSVSVASCYTLKTISVLFKGAVGVGNRIHVRNQFIATAFAQVFVTSFFTLQWIIVYTYFLATQYENKSAQGSATIVFALGLTNNLYYVISVRSFYLSTLTSRLFRETFITALLKLLPGNLHRQWNLKKDRVKMTVGTIAKREERPPRQM